MLLVISVHIADWECWCLP